MTATKQLSTTVDVSKRINIDVGGTAYARIVHAIHKCFAATGVKLNQGNIVAECIRHVLPAVPGEPSPPKSSLLPTILESLGAAGATNGHKPKRKLSAPENGKPVNRRTG